MMPWGHAGAGYLLYIWYALRVRNFDPHGPALIALLFGTQFPDLVDKPLAWTFGVLPSGRSLTHSLITAVLVIGVTVYAAKYVDRRPISVAFGGGYLSHLAADSLMPILEGRPDLLTNLGWPLLPPPAFGEESGFVEHFAHLKLTPIFWLQIEVVLASFAVAFYLEWTNLRSRLSASPSSEQVGTDEEVF